MTNTESTSIETRHSIAANPRFTVVVDGARVTATRLGTDDDGRTHFELVPDVDRSVFPCDRGYVQDGRVTMLRIPRDGIPKGADIMDVAETEYIGDVEMSMLQVGNSVSANQAREALR